MIWRRQASSIYAVSMLISIVYTRAYTDQRHKSSSVSFIDSRYGLEYSRACIAPPHGESGAHVFRRYPSVNRMSFL